MNIQHMPPQLFGVEKGKKLSMILISLILMYYGHACRENLWKSAGFWVCWFVCFTEFRAYKVCISFREKSLHREAKG